MNKSIKLMAVVLLLTLSACGYRLAGKAELDPVFDQTHVSYQGRGQAIAELIEKQFEANKFAIVEQKKATAIVDVHYEKIDREILSLDEDGKVREYELILRAGFGVKDAEGNILVRNQEVRLTRDFLFEINELLGKTSEEHKIYQEMRADASRLILYRLQAVSSETQQSEAVEALETQASEVSAQEAKEAELRGEESPNVVTPEE